MKELFGCLFFLLIGVLLFAVLPFLQIGRFFYTTLRGPQARGGQRRAEAGPSAQTRTAHRAQGSDDKIFRVDEGEYVDFEEVKE